MVHDGSRVVAASEALRDAGLERGESLERARILFPEAAAYPRDTDVEDAMWEDLLYLLHDLSPRLLSLRPGTALLEPWDPAGLREMARSLPARVGIAGRRFVAMLAAYMAPDRGVSEVTPELVRRLFSRGKVEVLREFGFDEELAERFRLFGFKTIDRLADLTRRHLEAQFGAEGARLFGLLHPEREEPGIPEFIPPPSVSAHCDFDAPVVEPGEIVPALDLAIGQAHGALAGRRTQLLTLRLAGRGSDGRGADSALVARRLLKGPVARRSPLFVAAERMLLGMLGQVEVERITVELGALTEPIHEQGGLFAERPAVYEAVRAIHHRYPGALVRARVESPDPVRPEEGVRYEPYPDAAPPRPKRRRR